MNKQQLWLQDVRQYGKPEAVRASIFFDAVDAFMFGDNVFWYVKYESVFRVENNKITHAFKLPYNKRMNFYSDWFTKYQNY